MVARDQVSPLLFQFSKGSFAFFLVLLDGLRSILLCLHPSADLGPFCKIDSLHVFSELLLEIGVVFSFGFHDAFDNLFVFVDRDALHQIALVEGH